MKHLQLYLTFALATFFMFSCSSDDGPTTQQLLQQRWFLVSNETVNPPGILIADDCQKTSYFDFGTNNLLVFEYFEGNPCESQGFQAYEYILTIDNNQIVINDDQDIGLWDIIEITNNSLSLTTNFGNTFNLIR